jgi:hypothetical protein
MSSENDNIIIDSPQTTVLQIEAPKKGGRPVGSKTTKYLSAADRNKAKTMYISGKSIIDICKEMGLSSANTLYRYLEKEQWDIEREKFLSKATEIHLDALMTQSLAETNEILSDLQNIRQVAIDAIQTGTVEPKKYSEASDAYIDAVQATMKVRAEALQLSFITEIGKILRDRIKDPQLLADIGNDLRELFKSKRKES